MSGPIVADVADAMAPLKIVANVGDDAILEGGNTNEGDGTHLGELEPHWHRRARSATPTWAERPA